MDLIELLYVIKDDTHIIIQDDNGRELGYYYNRDAIPDNLTKRCVNDIIPCIRKVVGYEHINDIPCLLIILFAD